MLLGLETTMLEENLEKEDNQKSWRKRQKYITAENDTTWRRWKRDSIMRNRHRWHKRQNW